MLDEVALRRGKLVVMLPPEDWSESEKDDVLSTMIEYLNFMTGVEYHRNIILGPAGLFQLVPKGEGFPCWEYPWEADQHVVDEIMSAINEMEDKGDD